MFETTIDDTECRISISYASKGRPGTLFDPPEYPEVIWEVLDLGFKPNPELFAKLTREDVERIDRECWDYLNNQEDDYDLQD